VANRLIASRLGSLVLALGVCAPVISPWAVAADTAEVKAAPSVMAKSPQSAVQNITDQMLAVIRSSEALMKADPDAYFGKIREVLEPSVSFDFIARNVMATYWSAASKSQRAEFTEVFTDSMVETLGKGLASYSELEIKTLDPQAQAGAKKVQVVQEVKGTEGTHRLSYTMALHRSGDWMLINVTLNGVNLGKSFRDQFAQAMRQHDNNVDQVIKTWSSSN